MILRWYTRTGYFLGQLDIPHINGDAYHTAQNKSRWGFAVLYGKRGMIWYRRGKRL